MFHISDWKQGGCRKRIKKKAGNVLTVLFLFALFAFLKSWYSSLSFPQEIDRDVE